MSIHPILPPSSPTFTPTLDVEAVLDRWHTETLAARPDCSYGLERAVSEIRAFINDPQATKLRLIDLFLPSLPPVFAYAPFTTRLESLDCSVNQLEALPAELGLCSHLRNLCCLENALTALPDELGNLQRLEKLNAAENRITALPDGLRRCSSLKRLIISSNELTAIPTWIGELTDLVELALFENALRTLPQELRFCTQLQKLSLFRNSLEELPDCIGQLPHLRVLDCTFNVLRALPEELGAHSPLEKLVCDSNQISRLPEPLGSRASLRKLSCRDNPLADLPSSLEHSARQLKHIDLSYTHLNALPSLVHRCHNLRRLYLSSTQISVVPTLPAAPGECAHLEHLDLSYNPQMRGQLASLRQLPRTCTINLTGNIPDRQIVDRLHACNDNPDYNGPRIQAGPRRMSGSNPNVVWQRSRMANPRETLSRLCGWAGASRILALPSLLEGADTAQAVHRWLTRLTMVADIGHRGFELRRACAQSILCYLRLAEESEAYRALFLATIANGNQSCGDGMALSIINLGVMYRLTRADLRDLSALKDLLVRGVWCLRQLEEIAEAKVNVLRASGIAIDILEVHLAYQIHLREALDLPIDVRHMHFFSHSHVTSDDLEEAERQVRARLADQEAVYAFLVTHDKWKEALKMRYPTEYGAITAKWEEGMMEEADKAELERIDREYKDALRELTRRALIEPSPHAETPLAIQQGKKRARLDDDNA